jgi:glyoxylase-like metal-dependent hydrolase (beta-lactamase superfamily II)
MTPSRPPADPASPITPPAAQLEAGVPPIADHHARRATVRGLDYPFGDRAPAPGELIDLGQGVSWIRLPLGGPLGHINVWAVEEADGLALIDTGVPTDACKQAWRDVLAGPLGGRPVSRVICTHMHPDHIGLAGWLCTKFGTSLWMTRGEYLTARLLCADARPAPPAEAVATWRGAGWTEAQIDTATARGWGSFARSVHRMPEGFVRVQAGDDLGGGWRAVIGSGHSPEHLCLVDEVRGMMIAGDQVLPRISSIVAISILEPEADPLGEWLASIARLRAELPGDLLVLPAHGAVFTGLHARLDALADGHVRTLDRLHARLAERPLRAVDCFGVMFKRAIDDKLLGMATGETLAHLQHLEQAGRAVREPVDGVWWWRAC